VKFLGATEDLPAPQPPAPPHARSLAPLQNAMNDASTRPRVDPSAPETTGGDDRTLGGGGLAARVRELEELLEATRTKLAAAEATIADYAEMYPTFNANEHIASVVFSHVTDVRTRVALAQVNTVWRKASKHASSLPPSLDFTGCPMVFINEGMCIYWTTKSAYVLGIEGVLDLPETRFLDLLEQAGADFSCSAHQCNLGNFYDSAKRYDKALEWYMKGARQGCEVCEYNLGIYYKYGQGVEKNIDTALEWFTKSAEKGFAKGQYEAGRIHYDKERHDSAFQWFTISALQGNTAAIANLGECYEKGEGVKKDFPEAFKLYAKAAEKGHATAKKNIRRLANALQ
jgi:tetratricopeptide (TPR) repeat protein